MVLEIDELFESIEGKRRAKELEQFLSRPSLKLAKGGEE